MRRTIRPTWRRRALALVAAAATIVAVGSGLVDQVASGAPGTPGVPGTNIFWQEDFSSGTVSGGLPAPLIDYTGGSGEGQSQGATYTADPNWLPPYIPDGTALNGRNGTKNNGECDGWILDSLTPAPTGHSGTLYYDSGCTTHAGKDGQGTNQDGWFFLQGMAYALGIAQGMTSDEAKYNQALSELTNGGGSDIEIVNDTQLQSSPTITLLAGHSYLVTALFAAVNCGEQGTTDPSEAISLVGGPDLGNGTGFEPCQGDLVSDAWITSQFHNTAIHVSQYTSDTVTVDQDTTVALRITSTAILDHGQAQVIATNGNDVAIDLPRIYDVTPQLDKEFSPTVIPVGATSTLTFTVTNTDDLQSKPAWSFTDDLPAGMTLAADQTGSGGDCVDAHGAPATVTAVPGSTAVSVAAGSFPAGQPGYCTVTVNVTASAGYYVNDADNVTASGLLPPGETDLLVTDAALSFSKTVDNAPDVAGVSTESVEAGTTVTYEFVATNTGTAGALTDVVIDDDSFTINGVDGPPLALDCGSTTMPAILAPGASLTCHATYATSLADIDAARQTGTILNHATATATDPLGNALSGHDSAEVDLTAPPAPRLTIDKQVDQAAVQAGQTVTYTIVATNQGNVDLTGVVIADPMFPDPGDLTCDPVAPAILTPGASLTCTAAYTTPATITVDRLVHNCATASATGVADAVACADVTVTPPPGQGGLTVTKVSDHPAGFTPGDLVSYTLRATNTGTAEVTAVTLSDDPQAGFSGSVDALGCHYDTTNVTHRGVVDNGSIVLGLGESVSCAFAYQSVVADASTLTNCATAAGTDVNGPVGSGDPVCVDVPMTPTPPPPGQAALTVTKVSDHPAGFTPGDLVSYTLRATNTGTADVTAVTVADDPRSGFSGLVTPGGCTYDAANPRHTGAVDNGLIDLAPGESVSCAVSYQSVVTDVSTLTNCATAAGTDANGPVASGDPVCVDVPMTPPPTPPGQGGLTVTKVSDHPAGFTPGDLVSYTLRATNTGTADVTAVTLTDDPQAGFSSAVDALGCHYDTTNVTHRGAVDNGSIVLAPGESVSCAVSYQSVAADVSTLTNCATAAGTDVNGPVNSGDPVCLDIPMTPTPPPPGQAALTVTKVTDHPAGFTPGDLVTYTLRATNTGTADVTDVTLADDPRSGFSGSVAALGCTYDAANGTHSGVVDNGSIVLGLGESVSCAFAYQSVAADVSTLTNCATAAGTDVNGPVDSGDPACVDVPLTPTPPQPVYSAGLTVTKLVDKTTAKPGDVLNYSVVITNTGDVALVTDATDVFSVAGVEFSNQGCASVDGGDLVSVTWTDESGVTWDDVISLQPGQAMRCELSTDATVAKGYTVTQADVSAGQITNQITVIGYYDGGTTLPASSTVTTTVTAPPTAPTGGAVGSSSPVSTGATGFAPAALAPTPIPRSTKQRG